MKIPVPAGLGGGIAAAALTASMLIDGPLETQIEKSLDLAQVEQTIAPPIAEVAPTLREIAEAKILLNITEQVSQTKALVENKLKAPLPIICPKIKPVKCPVLKQVACLDIAPSLFGSEITKLTPAQRLRVKADDLKGEF